MAKSKKYEDDAANEAAGFSGFGGHLLTAQANGARTAESTQTDDGYLAALASLGIEDVEQLVAIAAIPEARNELASVLQERNTDLQSLLDQVQVSLSAERLAQVNAPTEPEFGLGVLQPTPQMVAAAEADTSMEAMEAIGLPTAINLIPYMSEIRNQASRGTCVSFTLTGLNEYILRRRGLVRDLSEQHLYFETKLIDGAPSACGTWQQKATQVLKLRGQCREAMWPYNPNPPCNQPGPSPAQLQAIRADALNYRLTALPVPARSVADYKLQMSKQRPVTLSFPVYNSWYRSAETARTGRITMRIGNEAAVGGHAVCLVGYQDTPTSPGGGYFIVRNSWGTGWASASPYGKGYGTIPYQYITNDAYNGESFTAAIPGIASEDQKDLVEDSNQSTSVTIDVSPNIKITIASS
jgi:hypothetical protein